MLFESVVRVMKSIPPYLPNVEIIRGFLEVKPLIFNNPLAYSFATILDVIFTTRIFRRLELSEVRIK